MYVDDFIVVLSIRALPVLRSPRGIVAAPAEFLESLSLLLLKCRSLLQKGRKLPSRGNALLQTSE